jgi:hypothetical protein
MVLAAMALNIPSCLHTQPPPVQEPPEETSDEFTVRSSPTEPIEASTIPDPAPGSATVTPPEAPSQAPTPAP